MNHDFTLVNGTVIVESGVLPDCNILVEGSKIAKITQSQTPKGREIDVGGNYVSPGFIDLHIHGFGGFDATRGDEDSLVGMSKSLVKCGTTGFLPTLVSSPIPRTRFFLESVGKCMSSHSGARVWGAHLEGPFLNPVRRGVHREEYLLKPSSKSLKEMIGGFDNLVRILTFAPELDGGLELCGEIVGLGVTAAIGHTDATFEEASEGIQAGITHGTHTFNAMSGIHGRAPGAAWAVLASDRVRVEMIADGLHVNPEITKLALRVKQRDGVILVTDAVMPTGTDMTEFELAGVKANVRDGGSFTEEGNLCGSTLTLARAVKNVMTWNNLQLSDAIQLASLNPARELGIASRTGSLAEGKDADIVIMDKNLEVISTFVQGVQAYP